MYYSYIREDHRLRVFENRMQRGVFGPRREEAAEDWRRMNNEELHNLYASQNTIRAITSRTCSSHGRDEKRIHFGRIILECFLKKQGGKLWIGFIWLRIGTCGGLFLTQ
jgi:hypothetical protein